MTLADFGIALARDRAVADRDLAPSPARSATWRRSSACALEVDGRPDVFALGLRRHALITGRTPATGPSDELGAIEGAPIPLAPTLPGRTCTRLIARAVAPARLDRPSAAQLAREIGEALAPRLVRDARSVDALPSSRPLQREASRRAGALDHLLGIEVVPDAVMRRRGLATTVAAARAHRCSHVLRVQRRAARAQRQHSRARGRAVGSSMAAPPPTRVAVARATGAHAKRVRCHHHHAGGGSPRSRSPALAIGGGGLGIWRLSARGDAGTLADHMAAPVEVADTSSLPPMRPRPPTPRPPRSRGFVCRRFAHVRHAPRRLHCLDPRRFLAAPAVLASAGALVPAVAGDRLPAAPAAAPVPVETGWLLVYGDELVGSARHRRWRQVVRLGPERDRGRRRSGAASPPSSRRDGTRLPAKQVDVIELPPRRVIVRSASPLAHRRQAPSRGAPAAPYIMMRPQAG